MLRPYGSDFLFAYLAFFAVNYSESESFCFVSFVPSW